MTPSKTTRLLGGPNTKKRRAFCKRLTADWRNKKAGYQMCVKKVFRRK